MTGGWFLLLLYPHEIAFDFGVPPDSSRFLWSGPDAFAECAGGG